MRVCGEQKHVQLINDRRSGTSLELYYRMPTTEERQSFFNQSSYRKGAVIERNDISTRIKYGLEICVGFRAGDFGRRDKKGQAVPMASVKGHVDYHLEWKAELEQGAGDIMAVLAQQVFEVPAIAMAVQEDAEKNCEATSPQ